jgi:hypothetical protein
MFDKILPPDDGGDSLSQDIMDDGMILEEDLEKDFEMSPDIPGEGMEL